MLVSFIGCPCSGKTTTAAMAFAQLKEAGIQCEFVTEQARLYIAKKRHALGLRPEESLTLTPLDQEEIMCQQIEVETHMIAVIGQDQLLITDSSPLNSLLYMSEAQRQLDKVKRYVKTALWKSKDHLIFYAPPVPRTNQQLDPNRIHSELESLRIDKTIPSIMKEVGVWDKVIQLDGEPQRRLSQVTKAILTKRLAP